MRVLGCLAILAFLLVAGCAKPSATSGASSSTEAAASGVPEPGTPAAQSLAQNQANEPRPALVAPKILTPVLVGSPGAAEPNIAIAPDGTLYASNPCAIWRSEDHGVSWRETKHTGQTGCGDGDIAVDGAGNLYWLGLGTGIPFQVSTDRGESFSKAVDLSDGTGNDREWIDSTPAGKIYTAWRGAGGIEFNASPDGGATWSGKVVAGPDGDGGPVVHDPVSGMLYLPVVDLGPALGTTTATVHVHTSTDQGATWSHHDTATLPTFPVEPNAYNSDFPVIAVDSAGTAFLVYSAPLAWPRVPVAATPPEEANLFGIYLQTSTDHGATWSAPRLVSAPDKDARMPWIAAGKAGRVAVVWYENVNGVPGEVLPDQWNVMLWESVTADQETPVGQTVKLTPTPNHVGSLCTSGTGCAAADRSLLDYFEVAITAEGQPVAVWSSSILGTGVGVAVQGTDVYFGGLADGTPLR